MQFGSRILHLFSSVVMIFAGVALVSMSTTSLHAAPLRFQISEQAAISLQQSIYPELYASRDAKEDVGRAIRIWNGTRLWFDSLGPRFNQTLSTLSGFPETDSQISILPLWYYPSLGNVDPLIVPFGGFQDDGRIEAPLWGEEQRFQLCYLLAMRHLLQTRQNISASNSILLSHPMMQPGSLGFSLLSQQLAWELSKSFISDSTRQSIASSSFWQHQLSGFQVWEDQMQEIWKFSSVKPLALWLQDTEASRLVVKALQTTSDEPIAITEESIPSQGILGMTFRGSSLVVNALDTARAAFKWGLRSGDQLNGIDAGKPRNQKEAIEQLLAGWDKKSGRISVTRKGKTEIVYIRAVALKSATK
jgi:hypothetical protein